MEKRLVLLLFICLSQSEYIIAQIELNPETKEAIRSGTLINIGKPAAEPLGAPPILPLAKDFDIQPADTTQERTIDYTKMPPAVFALYKSELGLINDTIERLKKGAFSLGNLDLKDRSQIRIGKTPISISGSVNVNDPVVKDGMRTRGGMVTIRITFSMEDLLMGIFSKTERNKRRNRKKAKAWQYYNDYPAHFEK